MNTAHLHLMINHLPVIGSILGGFVLAYGLLTKSLLTKIAAYYVLIISAAGAVIAYLTGEEAEETVEKLQGVSKDLIDRHEDSSVIALIALIILGIFSLIGLFVTIKKLQVTRMISTITLVISLISFGLIAWTANTGGKIRHTEINSDGTNTIQDSGEKDDDD